MAIPTLVIAALLVVTGLAGYFLGHPVPPETVTSPTALIPMWVGIALGILGAISFNEKARKHAMHFAAMIGLLAAIGDGVQLVRTILKPDSAPDIQRLKIVSMSATLILCLVFVILCVRSFILARKNRAAAK